jgi:hypothetical protein
MANALKTTSNLMGVYTNRFTSSNYQQKLYEILMGYLHHAN